MKTIVCRCEDVSMHDLEHAVAAGYTDLEEIKRYTGFGTGMCQGKECLAFVASCVTRLCGQPPMPFTARAPLVPTPVGQLAQDPRARRLPDDVDVDVHATPTSNAVQAPTPAAARGKHE